MRLLQAMTLVIGGLLVVACSDSRSAQNDTLTNQDPDPATSVDDGDASVVDAASTLVDAGALPDASARGDVGAADSAPSPPAPTQILIDVPFVLQNPQLPRDCEVTSLAMMLQKAGVPSATADKM